MKLLSSLFVLLLLSCASSPQTTDEQWNAFLSFRKKFYNYTNVPIKSFTCKYESPALSDTIERLDKQVVASGKLKAEVKKTGELTFNRKENDYIIKTPGIYAERAGFWRNFWGKLNSPNYQDPEAQQINYAVMNDKFPTYLAIYGFSSQMKIPDRKKVFIKEVVSDSGGQRVISEVEEVSYASQLKGTLLTESILYKNGGKINSQVQHRKIRNFLLPVSSSAVVNDGLRLSTTNFEYEFQNVSGILLPKKISGTSQSEQGGTQVKLEVLVNFFECSVEK